MDEIEEVLGKRRAELADMLESRESRIELEKQHQIYGAINEIDLFLQTLKYYQENSIEKDIGPIHLAKPPVEQKGPFSKFIADLKGKLLRNQG